ncbi:hypothetical protein N9V92_03490 [Luminiphilus sp.]|nr:hypothetical protein [Luminiphilus sp.]
MESIDELRNQIIISNKRIEEISTEEAEARTRLAELTKYKKKLTEDMVIAEQKSREESQNIHRVREESESLKRLVASNEGSIKTQTRENTIAELEAKQKDYWTVLEERLAYQMEQLAEGLEGFEEESKDPAEVIKIWKAQDEGRNFNQVTSALREGQATYKTAIRDLCERHTDGGKILPSMKQARLDIFDRLLMSQALLPYWT